MKSPAPGFDCVTVMTWPLTFGCFESVFVCPVERSVRPTSFLVMPDGRMVPVGKVTVYVPLLPTAACSVNVMV